MGAPPSKIVLGLPFYGRTFVTNLEGNFGDRINDHAFQGPFTQENGVMNYNEICLMLSNKSSEWHTFYITEQEQAMAKYKDVEKNETRVVVFDNSRSIANKMKYAMSQKLAGAMIW